jgi:hypothetical protein
MLRQSLLHWFHIPQSPQVDEFKPVVEIKKAKKIQKIMVPVERVKVLEKEKSVKELKLPEIIAKDESKQVTATAEVTAYKGTTEVITTIDTRTGETEVLARKKPMPLLKPELILAPYFEGKIAGSDYAPIFRGGVQFDALRVVGDAVFYLKAEGGMRKRDIVNDYCPYGAVYVGARYEIELLK